VDELAAARTSVLDAVRRSLAQGGLTLRPADVRTWPAARVWQSRAAWLGPLAQTRERALVFVVVDVVERIATSTAWQSHDHGVRLDLFVELDEIDARAYELAAFRHRLCSRPADVQHGHVLEHSWHALVDRVAALAAYADRLAVLDSRPAETLTEDEVARLAAGWAGNELAAEQVRALTAELPSELPSTPD
jgi:hypothetical protein